MEAILKPDVSEFWPIWGATMALHTATTPHFALLRVPGDAGVHRARRALSAEVSVAARRAAVDPVSLQTRRECHRCIDAQPINTIPAASTLGNAAHEFDNITEVRCRGARARRPPFARYVTPLPLQHVFHRFTVGLAR